MIQESEDLSENEFICTPRGQGIQISFVETGHPESILHWFGFFYTRPRKYLKIAMPDKLGRLARKCQPQQSINVVSSDMTRAVDRRKRLSDKSFWRQIHRVVGLLLVCFVVFYTVTGMLLNHRKPFGYFQTRSKTVMPVQIQDQGLMLRFIESYRQQINRDDSPKVIRIKDGGIIEFLYGSHGKTTYIIDPQAGTMTRIEKMDNQPWHWLNRLHKAYKTSSFWQLLSDGIGALILLLTGTGLIILNYSRRDILFLTGGAGLLALGLWFA